MTGKRIRRRRRAWLLRGAVALGLFYGAGFALFLWSIPAATAPDDVSRADAIVALTGESARLRPAVTLLENGLGERLLITGVNRATTKGELAALLNGGDAFSCCADLGFEAPDTTGNAREAAAWARRHGYRSLIVVTADYHMPRSLLEFSARMPELNLVPFAVDSGGKGSVRRLPQLNSEYAKYLASYARLAMTGAMHS